VDGAIARSAAVKRAIGVAVMIVVLTLGAIAAMWVVVGQDQGNTLRITDSRGTVRVQQGDRSVAGAVGQTLGVEDVVTTGPDGRADIAFDVASPIHLAAGTVVQVRSVDGDGVSLELEGGALQATIRPGGGVLRVGNGGREIQATDADFEVALGPDDLFVSEVTRGEVRTTGIDGLTAIEAGQRASVPASGKAVLQPISEQLLLAVEWPEPKTRAPTTLVRGTTAPGSRVRLQRGAVVVDAVADSAGTFVAEVPLEDGKIALTVSATDPLGKVARVDGLVERDAHGPTLHGETTYTPPKP
jgi:hypothetical protein